jgi:hypothetical protein
MVMMNPDFSAAQAAEIFRMRFIWKRYSRHRCAAFVSAPRPAAF